MTFVSIYSLLNCWFGPTLLSVEIWFTLSIHIFLERTRKIVRFSFFTFLLHWDCPETIKTCENIDITKYALFSRNYSCISTSLRLSVSLSLSFWLSLSA